MTVMILRTLGYEFCRKTFAFYTLAKGVRMYFDASALYVLVGPMLHPAAVTQLIIVFVTVNQRR
jgi:hypothetical protein